MARREGQQRSIHARQQAQELSIEAQKEAQALSHERGLERQQLGQEFGLQRQAYNYSQQSLLADQAGQRRNSEFDYRMTSQQNRKLEQLANAEAELMSSKYHTDEEKRRGMQMIQAERAGIAPVAQKRQPTPRELFDQRTVEYGGSLYSLDENGNIDKTLYEGVEKNWTRAERGKAYADIAAAAQTVDGITPASWQIALNNWEALNGPFPKAGGQEEKKKGPPPSPPPAQRGPVAPGTVDPRAQESMGPPLTPAEREEMQRGLEGMHRANEQARQPQPDGPIAGPFVDPRTQEPPPIELGPSQDDAAPPPENYRTSDIGGGDRAYQAEQEKMDLARNTPERVLARRQRQVFDNMSPEEQDRFLDEQEATKGGTDASTSQDLIMEQQGRRLASLKQGEANTGAIKPSEIKNLKTAAHHFEASKRKVEELEALVKGMADDKSVNSASPSALTNKGALTKKQQRARLKAAQTHLAKVSAQRLKLVKESQLLEGLAYARLYGSMMRGGK
jgi:hypothetical protein